MTWYLFSRCSHHRLCVWSWAGLGNAVICTLIQCRNPPTWRGSRVAQTRQHIRHRWVALPYPQQSPAVATIVATLGAPIPSPLTRHVERCNLHMLVAETEGQGRPAALPDADGGVTPGFRTTCQVVRFNALFSTRLADARAQSGRGTCPREFPGDLQRNLWRDTCRICPSPCVISVTGSRQGHGSGDLCLSGVGVGLPQPAPPTRPRPVPFPSPGVMNKLTQLRSGN